MSRPPHPPSASDVPAEAAPLLEGLLNSWMHGYSVSERARVNPWMAALLYWPEYARNRIELSGLLLTAAERDGTFSHAQREWADIVLASHLETNVVMRTHLPDAIGAGVRIEAVEAVRSDNEDALTEEEAEFADYIRRVVDGEVTDESYDSIEARIGTRGVIEYTIFVTVLHETMRQFQAFGAEDPSDEEIDQLLEDMKSGKRTVPDDWRRRAVGPWDGPPDEPPAI